MIMIVLPLSSISQAVLQLISMGVYKFATLETTISKLLNLLALLILLLEILLLLKPYMERGALPIQHFNRYDRSISNKVSIFECNRVAQNVSFLL